MEMTVPAAVQATARPQAALVVTPHPVTLEGQRVYRDGAGLVRPGETLAAFLERHGVMPGQQWMVTIGGVLVHEMHWHRVKPRHGHIIECRRVPERDVLRIAAMVALTIATAGMNVWLQAGIRIVGTLIINKVLAPKQMGRPETTTSPTYSLTAGGRNQLRAFQPMGLVLGEPYAVPDASAQPYSFFKNGEQHLWQVFHCGINCADARALRVGATPLDVYQGVSVLRSGMASNNSVFPALGSSVDSIAGASLTAPNGDFGPWVERTSSPGTVRLAVDVVASLFSVDARGAYISREMDLGIEYRPAGTGVWLPFTAAIPGVDEVVAQRGDGEGGLGFWNEVITPGVRAVPAGVVRLVNASTKPLRTTLELAVPAGQYEVRLRKNTADFGGASGSNQVEWSALKSYQVDTASYSGESRLAIQVQATGQLNGAFDELNCQLVARSMPYWNGTAWVTATSRSNGLCNPGAQLLMLARGVFDPETGRLLAGLGLADEEINIESLQRFMVHCAANGFEFDLFLQDATSIGELMDVIAYAGMGELAYPDGRLGVLFFAEDDPLTGVINMANISKHTFEVAYDTQVTADELEVQYLNRQAGDTWASLRMLAPVVTSPRATQTTRLMGVSSEAHAAALLRFSMAQNVYQRKTITVGMDLEYMTYRRGDVIALSHDLTQWGYGGRLQACELLADGTVRLTLDDSAPGAIPPGYSGRHIGLRLPGELQMRVFPVRPFAGQGRVIDLDQAWPVGVPLPGAAANNPAHDTLWIYDFKAVPGQLLRVVAIEPNGSESATLTLVPEVPEFWEMVSTGTYTAPGNNSLLQPPPSVDRFRITEELARQGNTFFTELSVGFESVGAFERAELWGSTAGFDSLRNLAQGRSQSLSWRGGLDETWSLELRLFAGARQAPPYRVQYTVQGLRVKPPDVASLSISGDQVSWPTVQAPDLAGYELRFQFGNNPWWDSAERLHDGLVTESPYRLERRPSGTVTVLVKAVDTSGNVSENAAWLVASFNEQPVANALQTFAQAPGFTGTITGGTLVGGELRANALDLFYNNQNAPFFGPELDAFFTASEFSEMTYEFSVTTGSAGTLRLLTTLLAAGYRIEYRVGSSTPFFGLGTDPFFGPGSELIFGPPSAWALWPGSLPLAAAAVVDFRVTTVAASSQGVISAITAVLDVPDVFERLSGVAISAAGTRLPITRTYTLIRTVQLSVYSGGTGVTARIVDQDPALGPLVQILNSAGTAVAGVLNADVSGY